MKKDLNKRKNLEKYNLKTINEMNQSLVARDILQRQVKDRYNNEYFENGYKWFESGLPLEDAPEEIRNHASFISGFNHGKRVKLVNETLYDLGIEYFEKGISLIEVPEKYRCNKYFLAGYTRNEKKK